MPKKKQANIKAPKAPLFNGKPFDPHPPKPTFLKIKNFLDKSESLGVHSPDNLAKLSGIGRSSVGKFIACPKFDNYYYRFGNKGVAIGHPKEIKKFIQFLLSAEKANES